MRTTANGLTTVLNKETVIIPNRLDWIARDLRDVLSKWTPSFSWDLIRKTWSKNGHFSFRETWLARRDSREVTMGFHTFSEAVDRGARASQSSWGFYETWPSKFARQIFARQDSLCLQRKSRNPKKLFHRTLPKFRHGDKRRSETHVFVFGLSRFVGICMMIRKFSKDLGVFTVFHLITKFTSRNGPLAHKTRKPNSKTRCTPSRTWIASTCRVGGNSREDIVLSAFTYLHITQLTSRKRRQDDHKS
jgi:hypothetical protein